MAKPTTDKSKNAVSEPEHPLTTMAVVAPIVGWLIPGGGHILLKRYVRGALLLVSVVAMFLIGLGMQGRIYKPNGGDILDILGFVGDVGSGALYFPRPHYGLGQCDGGECRGGLWQNVFNRGRPVELYRSGGCASHCAGEKAVTITLSHFSAAVVFALFASTVFWHYAAQFDDGAGEVRPLLLCPVRRRSFSCRMDDGADSAVGTSFDRQVETPKPR